MLLDSNTREHHSSSLFISNTSDVATLSASPTISAYAPVALVTDGAVAGLPTSWADKVKQSIFAITGAQPNIERLDTIDPEGKLCIFLGDLNRPFLKDPSPEEFIAVRDLCAKSKGVLWLTQGAAMDYENIDSSLNQGFLRTLRTEYAGKRAVTLDLDPRQELWSQSSVGAIESVFGASFDYTQPLLDFEYAERDGVVHIPRFYKDTERNKMFFPKSARKMVAALEHFNQPERPLRLAIGTPGLLDTLAFVDNTDADSAIQPQQVQISPKAFGANSRDVLAAMGQLEANILGFECAGVISLVGSEAEKRGFKVGDRVAALMNGHFSSVVRTNWTNVVHIPENTSFEVAASLPYCTSTAYICLVDIAKVQKGESVLIHAATGGLGQAAIMIARQVGANIFVTASTPEKQQFLHERYDIPKSHIFNSREKSFTAGILNMTGGQGVDVVLNSLSGILLQESFNCVAQFGRFIEVGKKDFESDNSLQMGAFARSISFSSFDLLQFQNGKGDRLHAVLKEIMVLAEQKAVSHAEPLGVNALSDVQKTFRLLQTGKQMGKFVLSVSENEEVSVGTDFHGCMSLTDTTLQVLPRVPVVKLRADSSYLVVGGLGGIGHSVCEWLINHGARNLIVMSRSASADKIRPFVDEMAQHGCKVYASACDIADKQSVEKAFNDCDRNMPPIRGVIQGAMVLHDSLMERMTPTQWNGAIRPKVHGSWNLHERLHSKDVDFFVMLSSLSGVVGLASQCNYAAGNAYQDALAKYRSREGLHAAAIDIGVVQAVGVVAENDKLAAGLKRSGYKALTEDQVLLVIESAITSSPTDAMLIGIEGADFAASGLGRDQRFTLLKEREVSRNQQAGGKAGGLGELAGLIATASTFDEAVEAVVGGITKQLVDIFMMDEAEVDTTKSLTAYGVDSLSAVELRNMLALRGGAEVSIFDIMQATSVTGLATVVAAASSHIDTTLVPAK
jgi:NADPH:quinone reductase-like Zn-dependent oxidoreductase/acyl carrier protein